MHRKDLISLNHLSAAELQELLALSAEVKRQPDTFRTALPNKALALIFQKPSTRTRVSFQVGIAELGGQALVLNQDDLQLGRGESIADTARVLSRYVDGIVARVFAHGDIETLADQADIPVINGLSDLLHPCQAICDYFSMAERFGSLEGLPVTYFGDGNNVAHSLAYGAARLGVQLTIASPAGYAPNAQIIAEAQRTAAATGATIRVTNDPRQGATGAKVLYTDVWTSMGQEDPHQQRKKDLADYQVNAGLFALADDDAVFMHCLPAHRGEEVTAEVADGERSIIFDQAENRLHTQKAVLVQLMA